jgi:hypothetical protein
MSDLVPFARVDLISYLRRLARSWIGLAMLDEFRFEFIRCLGVGGLACVQHLRPTIHEPRQETCKSDALRLL